MLLTPLGVTALGPCPLPFIVGLRVAGHTIVTQPEGEPGQVHWETGLPLPLLTEITFLKLDKTTRTLEYNTQGYCLKIIRERKSKMGIAEHTSSLLPHSLTVNLLGW